MERERERETVTNLVSAKATPRCPRAPGRLGQTATPRCCQQSAPRWFHQRQLVHGIRWACSRSTFPSALERFLVTCQPHCTSLSCHLAIHSDCLTSAARPPRQRPCPVPGRRLPKSAPVLHASPSRPSTMSREHRRTSPPTTSTAAVMPTASPSTAPPRRPLWTTKDHPRPAGIPDSRAPPPISPS